MVTGRSVVYPALLRCCDGLDVHMEWARCEPELNMMEAPDLLEGLWDGWDANLHHLSFEWDRVRHHILVTVEDVDVKGAVLAVEGFTRVYKVLSARQRKYLPTPDSLYEFVRRHV